MSNSIKSLVEIFNSRQFRIPDFQRGYSWEKSQLEDFWQDLENLEPNYIHYTGVLTIDEVPDNSKLWNKTLSQNPRLLENSGYKLFSVIDGQQRLTTSIILISVILNSFNEDEYLLDEKIEVWVSKFLYKSYPKSEPCYIFGYDSDSSSFEFLKTGIFRQKSKNSNSADVKTVYTRNLNFAHKFFSSKVEILKNEEKALVFKKLIQQFKFNEFEVSPDLDIQVTFETMNNRGKPLSNLELLKNRLIYICSKLKEAQQDKDDLREEIQSCWKTVYGFLGKNEKSVLDDDEFLSVHRNVFFPFDRSNKVSAKEFLLGKTFTVSNVYSGKVTIKAIRDYIISLREAAKYWYGINFPMQSGLPEPSVNWLVKVNRLSFRNFGPALLASVFNFFEKKCTQGELTAFIKVVERYNFLVFSVSQYRSDTGKSDCLAYANEIYDNKKEGSVSSVTGWLDDDIYDVENGWLHLGRFQGRLNELFRKQKKGFYAWSGLTYFLFEYENYLRRSDDIKINWDEVKGNSQKSIEHIYPQNPKDDCWEKSFSSVREKYRERLSHDLGNLVLIPISKNSQFSNSCFSYKKKHTYKGLERGFFKGSHSEIEVDGFENWTPNEIYERGARMLNFLMKNWEIDSKHLKYVKTKELTSLLYASKFVGDD